LLYKGWPIFAKKYFYGDWQLNLLNKPFENLSLCYHSGTEGNEQP
jgi:hypothetical protein